MARNSIADQLQACRKEFVDVESKLAFEGWASIDAQAEAFGVENPQHGEEATHLKEGERNIAEITNDTGKKVRQVQLDNLNEAFLEKVASLSAIGAGADAEMRQGLGKAIGDARLAMQGELEASSEIVKSLELQLR
eukprot:1770934-Pyramimonas_sp.AAC.1